METRQRLHALLDRLPEDDLEEFERLLARRLPTSHLAQVLNHAPFDDEPGVGDDAAIDEAYADLAAGAGRVA